MLGMNRFVVVALFAIAAWCLTAKPRDSASTYKQIEKGRGLTANEAGKLEERLKKKPDDEDLRLQLLAYYAQPPVGMDLTAVKEARARHILWLIENDPKDGLGLFHIWKGIHRLHCQGDKLADPAALKRASDVWLREIAKNPESAEIRRAGVDQSQYCSPEEAERVLTAANDVAGLGRLYAAAVLGITGKGYQNGDPSGTDPEFRKRTFAVRAKQVLETATDAEMVEAASVAILQDGALLWADGKLDWDYTPLGNQLHAKAKAAAPDSIAVLTAPMTLPARGERPPQMLRVGGQVQASQLIRQSKPVYPPQALAQGIQGTVRMTAVLGLDGRVLHLRVDTGPPELIPASLKSAREWAYKPTLLNGKPCYVMTQIDVNYTLSQR